MAVKAKRYAEMLEKETGKKQTLMKAHLKAAKAGGFGQAADKYHRQSTMDKAILFLMKKKKGKK
jgi:hypothetical protein